MFESLKSTKTLEREMRSWLIENSVRIAGESIREDARAVAEMADERELLVKVANEVMALREDGQTSRLFGGPAQPLSDVLRWTKGLRLIQAFAKAKGWKIEPDPVKGYRVE